MTAVGIEPHADITVGARDLVDLVREYHGAMVSFARSFVGSTDVAEEAVQEAWLQVIRNSASFEGRSNEVTWLFGIVRNTSLRRRQAESRIREREELAGEDADPLAGRMHPAGHRDAGHWSVPPTDRFLPEDELLAKELADDVRAALEELPARQRQLVILRDLVGLSADEASEVTQVSGQAQRALLYRARGNLRSSLETRYQR